ncbi:hemolysin family protein [Pseudoblastomonas halimionae]|uniref:CBS domain-containing protein n=1 Tax=Alteriqipengyuania halimionae TaxID=1926630 RepID=A0A6I4U2B6_9SPHN|nr:hemolysin family protein [Alteriqipengyuania halimionae]MXP10058.1 CBS domain-containing protein [Alteriqipengyuania halimionae]
MPDNNGDADSRGGLFQAIRKMLGVEDGERSLRAQIEEQIDASADAEDNPEPSSSGPLDDFSPVERQMLKNLLHFSEHDADDVAVPRGEIVAVSADQSWDEVVATFAEHGHSRLPVYRDTLDEIIGMVLAKDLFPFLATQSEPPNDWTVLMRQPLFVPQARGALDVLADMRGHRTHLAIVVDEYSGTDGIITIEDLVEEIVGEIEDEHDDEPEESFREVGDGIWEADARCELEDIAKAIDPRLAEVEEAVDTLGGLAFVLAEQVPQPGAILKHDSGWTIEVLEGNERRVERVRLHPPEADTPDEEDV